MNRFMTDIMMPILNKMTGTCEVVSHRISENMDHPLPWKEKIKMKIHIFFCVFCNRYYKQLNRLRDRIRQTCDARNQEVVSSLPATFKEELKQKLRKAAEEQ